MSTLSRYKKGIYLVTMDSSIKFHHPTTDYLKKYIYVKIEVTDASELELVTFFKIEIFATQDTTPDNHTDDFCEIYRIPFPYERKFRVQILRLIKDTPKVFKK